MRAPTSFRPMSLVILLAAACAAGCQPLPDRSFPRWHGEFPVPAPSWTNDLPALESRSPAARAAMAAHLARECWCAWCGSRQDLQVHHIIPVAVRPDLEAEDSDLVTLCFRCHRAVGHPGGDTRKYISNLRDLCNRRLLCGPGTDAP